MSHVYFGELRSHLSSRPCDEAWANRLLSWSAKAYADSRDEWEEQWAPYLLSASSSWPSPLLTVSSLEALQFAAARLPGALFGLTLGSQEDVDALFASEVLGFVSSLALVPEDRRHLPHDAWAMKVARCTELSNLTHLSLLRHGLSGEGLYALTQAEHVRHLHSLELSENQLGDEGVMVLSDAPYWKGLTYLGLEENSITGEGVAYMAESSNFARLTRLLLSYNEPGVQGMRALAVSQAFPLLSELECMVCSLTDDSVRALSQATGMPHLQYLGLSCNHITADAAETLVRDCPWEHLTCLDLTENHVNTERAERLLKCARFSILT